MNSIQASFGSKLTSLWSSIDRFGFQPVVALFCVSSAFLFAHVLEEVRDGDTTASDRAILLAFRQVDDPSTPIGPQWLVQLALDVSALGGTTFICLLTAAAALFLALHKRWTRMITLVTAIGGAAILNSVFKVSLHRERPSIATHLTEVWSSSFPSGHAVISEPLI